MKMLYFIDMRTINLCLHDIDDNISKKVKFNPAPIKRPTASINI